MKQYYTNVSKLLILSLVFYLPLTLKSQFCSLCSGNPPDSIVQTLTFDPLTAVNTSMVFNQFAPSTGNLLCFKLHSVVSSVIDIDLLNRETFPYDYVLETFRRSNFTGPAGSGFFVGYSSPPVTYGPLSLAAFDSTASDSDQVHLGPFTVFDSTVQERTQLAPTAIAFQGLGTVAFDYLNTSTNTLLAGGSNYDLNVRGVSKVTVTLKYYYCPLALLASNVSSFVVSKKDNQIQLSWSAVNQEKVQEYIIEYSTDGKNFNPEASVEGSKQNSGQYNFSHPVNSTAGGYVYFRVKQVDENGKISYSAVRTVSLSSKAAIKITTYPNPATEGFNLSFDRLINGNFNVDLVSAAGQVVYSSRSRMNNANVLNVKWTEKPAPGIYFARVTNLADMQQQLVRVIIR